MTTQLIQKHLLKGTREFEIGDHEVNCRIKTPFKAISDSVPLSSLNPEPIISASTLDFVSRENGSALLSLYPGRPNTADFNAFINTLKQRIEEVQHEPLTEAHHHEHWEEPPAFDDGKRSTVDRPQRDINPERLEEDLRMLQSSLDPNDISDLVAAMQALKDDPQNDDLLQNLIYSFNNLGWSQGAVLTYAPYIKVLMSENIYEDF